MENRHELIGNLTKPRLNIQQKYLKSASTVNKSWSGVEASAEITS